MEQVHKTSVWQARKEPVNSSRFNAMRIRMSASIFMDSFMKGCGALFGTAQGPAFSSRK